MLFTSSMSCRARLVAASRPLVATVLEFAVSISASVPSTPTTSTSEAIMTSTSVNPLSEGRRGDARREAPIAGCVGTAGGELDYCRAIPALGGCDPGTRRGGPGARLARYGYAAATTRCRPPDRHPYPRCCRYECPRRWP